MENILKSASKLAFLAMVVGVNVALFTKNITSEQYIPLAAMAFTFYFSHKGTEDTNFLGK